MADERWKLLTTAEMFREADRWREAAIAFTAGIPTARLESLLSAGYTLAKILEAIDRARHTMNLTYDNVCGGVDWDGKELEASELELSRILRSIES